MSAYVAKHLQSRQRDWNVATQKRMAMTTSLLGFAKSIKMLGMANQIASKLQGLREHEIGMSKRLRWLKVAYNASGNVCLQCHFWNMLIYRSECSRHIFASGHFSAFRNFGPISWGQAQHGDGNHLYCSSCYGHPSSKYGHDNDTPSDSLSGEF